MLVETPEASDDSSEQPGVESLHAGPRVPEEALLPLQTCTEWTSKRRQLCVQRGQGATLWL